MDANLMTSQVDALLTGIASALGFPSSRVHPADAIGVTYPRGNLNQSAAATSPIKAAQTSTDA